MNATSILSRLYLLFIATLPVTTWYVLREPVALSAGTILQVLIGVLGAYALLVRRLKLQMPGARSGIVTICLFIAGVIWTTAQTSPLSDAFGLLVTRALLPLTVGYLGYLLLQQGFLSLPKIQSALLVALALVTLWGLLQIIGLLPSSNADRITGPYAYPNTFARMLVPLIFLSLPLVVAKMRSAWVVVGLALVVLLATRSYNGVTSAFLAGILVVVAMWMIQRKARIAGIAVALVLGAVGAVMAPRVLSDWDLRIC